jgi:hypothetical protein
VDHPELHRLWNLADIAAREGRSPDAAFEAIGLILQRPLERATYGSTPSNTLTFARTGGDGVHFSFVLRDATVRSDSPVLMGVPMHFDRPNVVVGRDLRDFLALGVGCGFFALERIVNDPDAFFAGYPAAREGSGSLRIIRAAFRVEPWTDPRAHLEDLKSFEHLLEAPAPSPPDMPAPSAVDFWRAQLANERRRPRDERDMEREAHMQRRLDEELEKASN